MEREDWKEKIILSSIPLRQLDEKKYPICSASGCIISYSSKRLILTVAHATGNMGNWAIEVKFEQGKGTKMYQIGTMNFLREGDISSGQFKDIDFSYAIIPQDVQSYYQEVLPNGTIKKEVPRLINIINFDIVPDKEEKYGFSGQTRILCNGKYLIATPMLELDMRYLKEENEFYVFKLSHKHPGHEYYQGCSGAPIIDTHGNIVALVVSGDISRKIIYGVSLIKYKVAIDIECGNIT